MSRFLLSVLLTAALLLVSCASSRKVSVGQHTEQRDSVRTEQTDSVKKSGVVADSSRTVSVDEQSHVIGTSEIGENEETITERIIETVDSAGNKTTTTDRRIHRKGTFGKHSEQADWQRQQTEEINGMFASVDSAAYGNSLNVGTHWFKNDSTNSEKGQPGLPIKTQVAWQMLSMLFILSGFLGAFIVFKLLNFFNRHKKE